MAEVGLLAPDARVELIEGVIVEMPRMGPRHAAAVRRLTELLPRSVGSRATVSCQLPLGLSMYSEPQPDLALLAPRDDFYATKHPSAEDVLLVIEMSDTTLRYDLTTKAALYAQHGAPELWVVDVGARRVHVFRHPSDGIYRETFDTETADSMTIESLPGMTLDLSAAL